MAKERKKLRDLWNTFRMGDHLEDNEFLALHESCVLASTLLNNHPDLGAARKVAIQDTYTIEDILRARGLPTNRDEIKYIAMFD